MKVIENIIKKSLYKNERDMIEDMCGCAMIVVFSYVKASQNVEEEEEE